MNRVGGVDTRIDRRTSRRVHLGSISRRLSRRLSLQDGGFLMHPDRYDTLISEGATSAEMSRRRLLRVHPVK